MLISLTSANGCPGVTTTTLVLASRWPRPAVVVDANPLFGDMLAGVGGGRLPATANLVELMVAARTLGVVEALPGQLVRPPGGHCPPFVPGLGAPGQAAGLRWEELSAGLANVQWADVIADCGRYGTTSYPLAMLTSSELVVVLVGSSLVAVRAAQRTVPVLRDDLARAGGVADHLVAVIVDPGDPYSQSEIAAALDLPVVGWLPCDPQSAAVWSRGVDPGRSFATSPLQRGAAGLAAQLVELVARRRAWLSSSRAEVKPRSDAGLVPIPGQGRQPVPPTASATNGFVAHRPYRGGQT